MEETRTRKLLSESAAQECDARNDELRTKSRAHKNSKNVFSLAL
jgi:hypothetical protein